MGKCNDLENKDDGSRNLRTIVFRVSDVTIKKFISNNFIEIPATMANCFRDTGLFYPVLAINLKIDDGIRDEKHLTYLLSLC